MRQVKVRVLPSSNYPSSVLHVTLTSKTLSENVISKLQSAASSTASKLKGKPQLVAVVSAVMTTLRDNLLVAVMDELQHLTEELKPSDTVKLLSKKGWAKFRFQHGAYFLAVIAIVPSNYPIEPVEIKWQASNFPNYLYAMLRTQVDSLRHLIVNGMTLEKLLKKEQLLDEKKEAKKQQQVGTDDVMDMKKDLVFLKQLGDLQSQNHVKGNRSCVIGRITF